VSVDFIPVNVLSLGNFIGFYFFVEVSVGFKYIVLTRVHNADKFLAAVQMYIAYIKQYGHVLRFMRPDAGTVENDSTVIQQLQLIGVHADPAAPECQFQNDVERSVQTVIKGVGAVLSRQLFLNHQFWALALLAFLFASNCTPNTLSGDYSPWYHITHRHPQISKWFKFYFGQPIVAVTLAQAKSSFKFACHGEFGYAVGSSEGSNGATLVYLPSRGTHAVYSRLDVRPIKLGPHSYTRSRQDQEALLPTIANGGIATFPILPTSLPPTHIDISNVAPGSTLLQSKDIPISDDFYKIRDITSSDGTKWTLYNSDTISSDTNEPHPFSPPPSDASEGDLTSIERISGRLRSSIITSVTNVTAVNTHVDDVNWQEYLEHWPNSPPSPISISATNETLGIEWLEWNADPAVFAGATINALTTKPPPDPDMPTLKQAVNNAAEWVHMWQPASDKEFTTIDEMGVYDEIAFEDIPVTEPIYPTKMIFKKKRDSVGNFLSAKARLCVIGNWITQAFSNLFAPTANEKALKLLFAIAVIFGMTITGIDIKGAFLYPDLPKPVYVSIPALLTGGEQKYWKLKKTLYGLPQSPQAFYKDIS
jgi:hypothetical protein